MNSFEFGHAVKIAGEVYYISEDFKRIKGDLESTQKVLADPKANDTERQIAYASGIDEILGEGSFQKIFGGRPFSYIEATELIKFLTDEVKELRKQL